MIEIELNEREKKIRDRVLQPNQKLRDRLLVVGILAIGLGIPLFMVLGPGGYVYPLFLGGLFALISSLILKLQSVDISQSKSYILFTEMKNLKETVGAQGEREYRLFVKGGPYRIDPAVPMELPDKGQIAVFFHDDKETIFYITRKAWIDPERIKTKKAKK